ncbi:transcription cofactor vestigial-like protein 2 isoform X2 [Asterias rubens]|uniref:transcription cofactor vestigial-like protein 2 isoform X2 n=1 Tax=Asterias rubens TaxID=7604 RepID=UPI0014555E6A|nr:transcription cofactor vestigial-like protein 2 isoform X2 [Asterias rubens]
MSCLDVMYQSAYQPYQHYPFYQRHFTQKYGHYKMQEPPDHEASSYTPHTQSVAPSTSTSPGGHSTLYHPHQHHHHNSHNSSPVNGVSHPHQLSVKEEDKSTGSDAECTVEAEYINSRCVLFTYYTGELNKVVDEHFNRALNQPSSFSSDGRVGVSSGEGKGGQQGIPSEGNTWNSKNGDTVVSPMCQRNLPASFWNSNYNHNKYTHHHHHHSHHSTPSSCQGSATNSTHHDALFPDPYPSSLHRSVHQPDPWHYPFVSQSSYTHRSSIHDLTYGMSMSTGGSAFNPRYSSLLIQPPVRPGRLPAMPGQCDFTKGGEGWPSTYPHGHTQQIASEIPSYSMDSASTSALESQDTSKDLYWF